MWQKIKNYYHLLQAIIAATYFGFPSKKLVVIGVTGTDGKTTTVTMIYHILKEAGQEVSMISSLGAQIGSKKIGTGMHVTTPNPYYIQKYLKLAKDAGSKYFVLEATSHGLDQNRLSFVKFKVAALTNVSDEHLDYHKNLTNYMKAKSKLFQNVDFFILNIDDYSFNFLKKIATGKKLTYGRNPHADFNPKNFAINLKISGDYNLQNALAAAATVTALGINKKIVIGALSSFQAVKGRMDQLKLGQNFRVYVDFAHTPNGLENALIFLNSIRLFKNTRVISVFGAAGERDKLKRIQMGKVAAKYSDICILTAEDPRKEKVEIICAQIAKGLKAAGKAEGEGFYIIPDRQVAINYAAKIAKSGDIVGLFGKGHEKSMSIGKKEFPWDEFSTAKEAIKRRLKTE